MLKIASVEYYINSQNVLNIKFDDESTLLDADIVVIDPSPLHRFWEKYSTFSDGTKRLLTSNGSDDVRELFAWRSRELKTLLGNSKVVFAFMSPVDGVLGEIEGSSKYKLITNYDWLPSEKEYCVKSISPGSGSSIILKAPSHPVAPYYKAFKDELSYDAYLEITNADPNIFFLVNKSGNPVGCSIKFEQGLLVLVPPPPEEVDDKKLLGVLIQCAKPIITKDFRTPEPEWTKDYNIPGEVEILGEIEKIQKEIDELSENRNQLELKGKTLSDFRVLLYEQGTPLEDAVLRAFRLMGFNAERLEKEDMEHDAVLQSPEGRALAEVEGKDNDAIRVDKLDQLTRVVDEDFHERGVYSEGVLIGNAYRFTHPKDRKDAFTEKVHIAAERKGLGLLTTVEIFGAVIKILKTPNDEDYKTACREAVLEAKGKQISFPIN